MKKLLMTGAAIAALSTAASASTFSLIGGTAWPIPGGAVNDVLTNTFGMGAAQGFYGAQVSLDSAATVMVDFMGYEAGFVNKFSYGGTTTDTEVGGLELGGNGTTNSEYGAFFGTPLPGLSYSVVEGAGGLLSFSFSTSGGGAVPAATVLNGANPDDSGGAVGANFFVSYGQNDPSTVYLWFDDAGGGNDDNHDDFVVRLTTNTAPPGPQPVPLPATGLLLLGALGGIAAAKRRK